MLGERCKISDSCILLARFCFTALRSFAMGNIIRILVLLAKWMPVLLQFLDEFHLDKDEQEAVSKCVRDVVDEITKGGES